MKKFLVSLLSTVLLFSCATDEEPSTLGGVYGIISDVVSGEPIRNVSVVISPGNLTAVTGADGHYEFVDLEAGQYTVQCSAMGYQTNSRQIIVPAGNVVMCDIALMPAKISEEILLVPSTGLNFGTKYNQLEFRIENIGNAGAISWTIHNHTTWIETSPRLGSTEMGKSSSVIVIIDRTKITENSTSFITVETSDGSQSIRVSVECENGSGGNSGDSAEDYSSAEVISCDSKIIAKIVDCKRLGDSVVFNYTLMNEGLGNIKDWRIYPPASMSVINGGSKSIIFDNLGNEYVYPIMTFREKTGSQNSVWSTSFPEEVICNGRITINDFSAKAEKLNVILGVYAYQHTPQLARSKIEFMNIPIY